MKIFTGTSNLTLAQGIVDYLGMRLGEVEISRFPDGETFVKFQENVRGGDIFIVQSICYPPNERLMELLIMMMVVCRHWSDESACCRDTRGRQCGTDQHKRHCDTADSAANRVGRALRTGGQGNGQTRRCVAAPKCHLSRCESVCAE